MALWPLGPQGNSLVFSQEAQPPAPWPVHPLALGSSRPAPCQGQPEATGWKQGCGSPHAFDGRSPCPVPQHSLILIHPLFHVRHGLLFPLQRERERERDSPGGQRASRSSLWEALSLPFPSPGPAAPGPRPCRAETPFQQGQAAGS